MKKLRTNLLLIAVFALVLTGCLSENNYPDTPVVGSGDITLSLRVETPDTRGASLPVEDGDLIEFTSGDLFLVSITGQIIHHFSIVERGGAATDFGLYIINRGDFDAGAVTIPDIWSGVTEAIIVGNPSNIPLPTNAANIGSRLINVIDQHCAMRVNLFGRAPFLDVGGTRRATVPLSTNVARLEVGEIRAIGSNVTQFVIDGIFIDSFFSRARIDGAIDPTSWTYRGLNADAFAVGQGYYLATSNNALFDIFPTGLTGYSGNNRSVTPVLYGGGNDYVWGYQLFAQTNNAAAPTHLPAVVIRFSEVTVAGEAAPRVNQFVTIHDFWIGNQMLTGIRAGRVYHIPLIEFDEFDLSNRPNETLPVIRSVQVQTKPLNTKTNN